MAETMTRRELEHALEQAKTILAVQERSLSRAWLDLSDAQSTYEKTKESVSSAKSTVEIWEQRLSSLNALREK